jgi:hypothetical protein
MRSAARRFAVLAALASLVLVLPAAALGAHSLRYVIGQFTPAPQVHEHLEDPCGVAVDSHGNLYVSDYYHDKIQIFGSGGGFITQISDVDPIDGPCGIAVDPAGRIYVNAYHEGVLTLTPSAYPPTGKTTYSPPATAIGGVNATGLALDPLSGNLLVDERTSIAEYETPVAPGDEPLRRIGTGALEDGYGLAVSGFAGTAGYVYVADVADSAVEVFDPATSLTEPVASLDGEGTPLGRFNDLVDAALAVDDANGHLYVVDNVDGPLYEHPRAGVEEFDPAGAFVGEVLPPGFSGPVLVHGGPTGIAVDNTGAATQSDLYVSSGNSEKSSLLAFGPTAADAESTVAPGLASPAGSAISAAPVTVPSATPAQPARPPASAARRGGVSAKASTVVQRGGMRVSLAASIAPRRLPRDRRAPVTVSFAVKIGAAEGSKPRQLRRLRIEINREGRLDAGALPVCPLRQIQPASTSRALAACRSALVGRGHLSADVVLPQLAPFPSSGDVLAFNGRYRGKPAILAHVYGTDPFPTSYTLPFVIESQKGTFGTALRASLPQATGEWGYLTGLSLRLGRRYRHDGRTRSYVSAGCPAPSGFSGAVFPLARAGFAFAGGPSLLTTVSGQCRSKR